MYSGANKGLKNAKSYKEFSNPHLLIWHLKLPTIDRVNNIMRGLTIDRAPNRLRRAQDLLHSPTQLLRQRFRAHSSSDLNDLIEGDVSRMLDVLLLLPVARGLLESSDDERGCGGDDGDCRLTVLDRELDGYSETFPGARGLCDIFSDFLWRLQDERLRTKSI